MINESIVLGATTTITALATGLFYTFTCLVSPGLSRLKNREYLVAMQFINLAVKNPAFFLGFLGAPVLLVLSTLLYFGEAGSRFPLILTASIIYLVGAFGVTIARNIPLNEALARLNVSRLKEEETILYRKKFERPWNAWNTLRSLSSTLSLSLLVLALLS